MDDPVFDHEGPWTEADYLAVTRGDGAHDDGRVEVVDGTLLVGPDVSERRAVVSARLESALTAALPAGLVLLRSAPLRLGLDCILIPDFVVTNAKAAAAASPADAATAGPGLEQPLDAADALMVVEVIGRDHGAIDRSFKPQLYARSRIPYSLLIDHDAPFAVAEMIISGRYHEYAAAAAGQQLRLDEPFRLELDLGALTAHDDHAGRSTPAAS